MSFDASGSEEVLLPERRSKCCGAGADVSKRDAPALHELPLPPSKGASAVSVEAVDDSPSPPLPKGPVGLSELLEHLVIQLDHNPSLPLSSRLKVKALMQCVRAPPCCRNAFVLVATCS